MALAQRLAAATRGERGVAAECSSFPPLAAPAATRLILGSMPGEASLRAGEYYAHPANCFWRLMGELFAAGPQRPYAERVAILNAAGVAVWDVIASCRRSGSLDSSIDERSLVVNDFAAFFAAHPNVSRVYFNGAKAEQCFRRHVAPRLDRADLDCVRLPSTSPANASIDYNQKLLAWRALAR